MKTKYASELLLNDFPKEILDNLKEKLVEFALKNITLEQYDEIISYYR